MGFKVTTAIIDIPDQRVCDLLSCAFGGGSTYWADISDRADAEHSFYPSEIPLHAQLWVEILDDVEESKKYRLDRAALERGLQLMPTFGKGRHWRDFIAENEDATTGDVFLQLCVFGDVIYG